MKSNHFKNRIPVFELKNPNLGAPLFFPHGLRTPNEGINQRNLKIWGRCGRQNITVSTDPSIV